MIVNTKIFLDKSFEKQGHKIIVYKSSSKNQSEGVYYYLAEVKKTRSNKVKSAWNRPPLCLPDREM